MSSINSIVSKPSELNLQENKNMNVSNCDICLESSINIEYDTLTKFCPSCLNK